MSTRTVLIRDLRLLLRAVLRFGFAWPSTRAKAVWTAAGGLRPASWPVEPADLVDHFPAQSGRVVRALVSPPDWDSTPCMLAASGNCHTASRVLREVVGRPDFDPGRRWSDDGGSWHAPGLHTSSARTGE
jgi:hypothetical protein